MLKGSNYNPDVLNCLANLSSDEVFTPPAMANRVLDLLPARIWRDKNATFLDPVCKSGVFLREIAKRLDAGLEKVYPTSRSGSTTSSAASCTLPLSQRALPRIDV
jgi:site-specific DNA-methyltransferase (adenine-specific)